MSSLDFCFDEVGVSGPPSLFYHGAREAFEPGDEISSGEDVVCITPKLDAAIWAAELSPGDGEPRVYVVRAKGHLEEVQEPCALGAPPHLAMSWRARGPLEVVHEITEWPHYHGTRADLQPGDLIEPGHLANFGAAPRTANFVYFTRTQDAAIWGAELAAGEGVGRIYTVEPTGAIEDDPNLTDMKFPGNPTKSFRSRAPLRVIGELEGWSGHPEEVVRAMKEGLARLEQAGIDADD